MSRVMPSIESVLWDDWHVIAELETLRATGGLTTALFDRAIVVSDTPQGPAVEYADGSGRLPVRVKYQFVWTSLGDPQRNIVDFPESVEADRYEISTGSFGVRTSGPRVIENFLDLAHFPYVHAGYLGNEPDTEVFPYTVRVTDDDEIRVTDCRFHQPRSSPAADQALEIQYVYRVLRPYTAVLEKTNAVDPQRMDIIALFVQPLAEDRCVAHMLCLSLAAGDPDQLCRSFQRTIFCQDKPILENQRPARLPLAPRMELPIRADATSLVYRKWLSEHGVCYGVIRLETLSAVS